MPETPAVAKSRISGKTENEKFSFKFNLILPVESSRKNKFLRDLPKSNPYSRRLVPLEGRIAIVTDPERDAVDTDGASDEDRPRYCAPDPPTTIRSFSF